MKNIKFFYFENFHFLVVNFSVYLYRRVFIMMLCRICVGRSDSHVCNYNNVPFCWVRFRAVCFRLTTACVLDFQYRKQETDQETYNFPVLTLSMLWANSADDILMIFFSFSQKIRIWHFMEIISHGDNLNEMSNPILLGKKSKCCLLKFYQAC